jgi:hypothetical protein
MFPSPRWDKVEPRSRSEAVQYQTAKLNIHEPS